ncbi:hypothetical protein RJZ90_003903 [Blastomyces dermatitidis]
MLGIFMLLSIINQLIQQIMPHFSAKRATYEVFGPYHNVEPTDMVNLRAMQLRLMRPTSLLSSHILFAHFMITAFDGAENAKNLDSLHIDPVNGTLQRVPGLVCVEYGLSFFGMEMATSDRIFCTIKETNVFPSGAFSSYSDFEFIWVFIIAQHFRCMLCFAGGCSYSEVQEDG